MLVLVVRSVAAVAATPPMLLAAIYMVHIKRYRVLRVFSHTIVYIVIALNQSLTPLRHSLYPFIWKRCKIYKCSNWRCVCVCATKDFGIKHGTSKLLVSLPYICMVYAVYIYSKPVDNRTFV